MLFFDVSKRFEASVKTKLFDDIGKSGMITREEFVRVILSMYSYIKDIGWFIRFIREPDEYNRLLPHLPDEAVKNHILADDSDVAKYSNARVRRAYPKETVSYRR
jgi:hypothetical protein